MTASSARCVAGEPQWRNELSSPLVVFASLDLLTEGWTQVAVGVMEAGVGRELDVSVFFLVTHLPLDPTRAYVQNESEWLNPVRASDTSAHLHLRFHQRRDSQGRVLGSGLSLSLLLPLLRIGHDGLRAVIP